MLIRAVGPIGLLAALLGVQRSLDVDVSTGSPTVPSPNWRPTSAPLPLAELEDAFVAAAGSYGARRE